MSTKVQYAGLGIPKPPPLTAAVTTGNLSAAKSKTYYLFLSCRCRGGWSLHSSSVAVSVEAGQRIDLTIPASARPAGSDVHEFAINLAIADNPESSVIVAQYPGYTSEGIKTELPATISLDQDEHLAYTSQDLTVSSYNELPSGYDFIRGMRRYVSGSGEIVEARLNGSQQIWELVFPSSFSSYISNTQSRIEIGCDRELSRIDDSFSVIVPSYSVDGSTSELTQFWIVNDASTPIPSGRRIEVSFSINGKDVSSDFSGLAELVFLGYVDTRDGTLDEEEMDTGISIPYTGNATTALVLEKDLPGKTAYSLAVRFEFTDKEIGFNVPQGATIRFHPRISLHYAKHSEISKISGDFIVPEGDRRRIVPDGTGLTALASSGSGAIAGFVFENIGETYVAGIVGDTANQYVIITNNGSCYIGNTIPSRTGALRAILGTINGVSVQSAWSESFSLNGSEFITVIIEHPTTIRSDYPDIVAGMTAKLNATGVKVYVRNISTGEIIEYDATIVADIEATIIETIEVGGDSGSNLGTSLPIIDEDLGLFVPTISVAVSSGSTTLSAGDYDICVAYYFEDTVTTISHKEELGCVPELAMTLTNAINNIPSLVNRIDEVENILEQIPGILDRLDALEGD